MDPEDILDSFVAVAACEWCLSGFYKKCDCSPPAAVYRLLPEGNGHGRIAVARKRAGDPDSFLQAVEPVRCCGTTACHAATDVWDSAPVRSAVFIENTLQHGFPPGDISRRPA